MLGFFWFTLGQVLCMMLLAVLCTLYGVWMADRRGEKKSPRSYHEIEWGWKAEGERRVALYSIRYRRVTELAKGKEYGEWKTYFTNPCSCDLFRMEPGDTWILNFPFSELTLREQDLAGKDRDLDYFRLALWRAEGKRRNTEAFLKSSEEAMAKSALKILDLTKQLESLEVKYRAEQKEVTKAQEITMLCQTSYKRLEEELNEERTRHTAKCVMLTKEQDAHEALKKTHDAIVTSYQSLWYAVHSFTKSLRVLDENMTKKEQ